MHCRVVRFASGGSAVVCGGRSSARPAVACVMCGSARRAQVQCDHPIGSGKTCSAWLCPQCAIRIGPNQDRCPDHAPPASDALARRIRDTAARLKAGGREEG
jgi:hypothetical protein